MNLSFETTLNLISPLIWKRAQNRAQAQPYPNENFSHKFILSSGSIHVQQIEDIYWFLQEKESWKIKESDNLTGPDNLGNIAWILP